MGKATGFIDTLRKDLSTRPVSERILDWQEVKSEPYNKEELQAQAGRCMDCSIPFCHTGSMINNALVGCPLHNLTPEFNEFVYQDMPEFAYLRLIKNNNFPEFTSRVCPAPCESACSAGLITAPVSIRNIELHIIENAFKSGMVTANPPKIRTNKKVAVVGSGPAGLACADQLNKKGHKVTVFERDDRAGGLLMYGIPNMKLEKKIIQRRINLLIEEGVDFEFNTEIGINIPAETTLRNFDAIVLCTGSTVPREINIPGNKAQGVYFAKEYLHKATKSLLDSNFADANFIDAHDKDVVVIGGGDTGTDCVATAIRQGCRSVKQLEIMPCLPNSRAVDNPWPQFPRVHKVDYGQQEALELFHNDPREYCVLSKEFLTDENNVLTAVKTARIKWDKGPCQMTIQEVANTEKILPAQLVLLAMGFTGAEQNILDAFNLERSSCGTVATRGSSYQTTSAENIFVAGDANRGQSLVVWAIIEGREAAQECHEFLKNSK